MPTGGRTTWPQESPWTKRVTRMSAALSQPRQYQFGTNVLTGVLSRGWGGPVFLTKYDHLGNLVWARQSGEYDDCGSAACAAAQSGGIFLAGMFEDVFHSRRNGPHECRSVECVHSQIRSQRRPPLGEAGRRIDIQVVIEATSAATDLATTWYVSGTPWFNRRRLRNQPIGQFPGRRLRWLPGKVRQCGQCTLGAFDQGDQRCNQQCHGPARLQLRDGILHRRAGFWRRHSIDKLEWQRNLTRFPGQI